MKRKRRKLSECKESIVQIVSEKRVIYFLVCLGCITISFNVAAITAAIPVISLDLKLPAIQVSKVIPFYMIPYGVGALIYAPLTKKISYRAVLAGTLALFSVACFACGMSNDLNSFLIARVAMGVTGASAIPLGLMLIGELFDRNVRGRLVGLFFGCSFFASLAGIVLSGLASWRWLFFVPAISASLNSVSFFILKSKCLKRVNTSSVNYLKALCDVKIRNVFIFIFAISFFYHGVHKWFGVYLDSVYRMDKLTISFFFILGAIGGLAGQLLGGYISDKKGRLISCYIGIIGLALVMIALAGHYSFVVLGILIALVSVFWTIGHNGVSTVLTDFPDKDRPVIASLNSSVRFISGGIGFSASSYFVDNSFGLTFLGIGICTFLLTFFVKSLVPQH